jgi:hypothetical protein
MKKTNNYYLSPDCIIIELSSESRYLTNVSGQTVDYEKEDFWSQNS